MRNELYDRFTDGVIKDKLADKLFDATAYSRYFVDGVTLPEGNTEIKYEYRWYDIVAKEWEEWKPVISSIEDIRYYISQGNRYQIRTLTVTDIEGWVE